MALALLRTPSISLRERERERETDREGGQIDKKKSQWIIVY